MKTTTLILALALCAGAVAEAAPQSGAGQANALGVPGAAAVMHAMTRRPCVSFASRNCLTAHWRHAPTDPIAGCQQK